MKTLIILTSVLFALSANASIGIRSIELKDSTVIRGSEVSAVTLNNSDSMIVSVELFDGSLINALEVKSINLSTKDVSSKLESGLEFNLMAMVRGGTDSGD